MTTLLDFMNDPVNVGLSLVLFVAITLVIKVVWPLLRTQLVSFVGIKNYRVVQELVMAAVQAAEQARVKGELDRLAGLVGLKLPVNLSDTEKCREYVLYWVRQQLDKVSWGHLIDPGTIYTLVLSALRSDMHKGPTSALEQIRGAAPEELVQILTADQIARTNDILRAIQAGNVGLATPQIAPRPSRGSRR